MKKFFAWALALALVLTIMPVLGVHNHAEAEGELPCSQCSCANYVIGPMGSSGPCGKCYHKKSAHIAHTHNMVVTNTVKATCVQEGFQVKECDGCTQREYPTLPIDPDAHNLVNNKCTNVNEKTGDKCNYHVCTWSAKGNGKCQTVSTCTETHAHTDADFNKVDPSSVVAGNCMTPGSHDLLCNTCGAAKTVTGEKDANNHKFVMGKIECQNGCGEKCPHTTWTGDKCSVCGTGHNHPGEAYTEKLESAATCVKPAVYTYTYACGATETITGEVDKVNGHTWAPTGECANTGCDQACTHNWVDGVCTECTYTCKHPVTTQTTTVPGNCKNVGSADLICDECGEITDTVELPIDEDNHEWVVFPFGAGYCVRCNEVNVNYDDFEDVLPEKEPVENPCDEHQWASLAFGAWYCTKCGAAATDINPLEPEICDHADTYINVIKAATCKTEGSAEKICDICETVLDANVVLPIDKENGHDLVIFPFGASWCNLCYEINVDYEDFIEPENPQDTCEHDWAQVGPGWYCYKCNGVTLDEPKEPEVPEEEEVCEEHQWASLAFGAWYCTKCGVKATDINPLDPEKCDHADTYLKTVTPATCVAKGVANKLCDICETVLEEGVELPIDPNAHQWGADANGDAYCVLCQISESELPEEPKEEPCEHDWAAVATGWYCWKCNTVTLDDPYATEPAVYLGDVNGDGCVDGRDEVRLMRYLVGQGVSINKANSDLNQDGAIDGRDEIRLLYKLL